MCPPSKPVLAGAVDGELGAEVLLGAVDSVPV